MADPLEASAVGSFRDLLTWFFLWENIKIKTETMVFPFCFVIGFTQNYEAFHHPPLAHWLLLQQGYGIRVSVLGRIGQGSLPREILGIHHCSHC